MKILYVSEGLNPDYLCDLLLHGLRTLLGPDVVDIRRIASVYRDYFFTGSFNEEEKRGRWYTVYGLLPDDNGVDRTDIVNKIRNKYFDYVIYGSVHRCLFFLKEVRDSYDANEIIFIDGEDHTDIASIHGGYYFKRELSQFRSDVVPIQFAVPKEKVVTDIPEKIRNMAPCDSRNRDSFVFNTELEYYRQYGESYFAYTERRGGWDRIRHYEIIAAGALPYFNDLESCPVSTLTFLPKHELFEARKLCDNNFNRAKWDELFGEVRKCMFEKLTTEALAKYVIDTVGGDGR